MKLLAALKTRLNTTKFNLRGYFRMKNQTVDESDSDSDDDQTRERTVTPVPKKTSNKPNETFKRPMTLDDASADQEMSSIYNSHQATLGTSTPIFQGRPMTPTLMRVMNTPDRAATPFRSGMIGRKQCQALTAKNAQCKNAAISGTDKCRMHKV